MDDRTQNSQVIKSAFSRLHTNAQNELYIGLQRLLDYGVKACLMAHDAKHQRHLESGDSYGWVILYNGVELKRELFVKGQPAIGNANAAIDSCGVCWFCRSGSESEG